MEKAEVGVPQEHVDGIVTTSGADLGEVSGGAAEVDTEDPPHVLDGIVTTSGADLGEVSGDAAEATVSMVQVELSTLGGFTVRVDVMSSTTVGELKLLALEKLEMSQIGTLMLGDSLLPADSTLKELGITEMANIVALGPTFARFEGILVPKGNPNETDGVSFEGDDQTVVRFGRGRGYRCVFGTPMASSGVRAVAFDFVFDSSFTTSVAVGLHVHPEAILDGPLDSAGWIGATTGGLSLFCPFGRHSGDTPVVVSRGEKLEHDGSLYDIMVQQTDSSEGKGTVVLIVDDIAKRITFCTFPTGDLSQERRAECAIPDALLSSALRPCVCGTNVSTMVVTIRSVDPTSQGDW